METRKKLPQAVLSRIYFIDRQIASGTYPNTHSLAAAYETGTTSISRDIEFMRDTLDAPIEYSAQHRGYFYTEKSYRLPARFASANDMLALGMAKTLLSLYHETPLYESARQLLENITAPLAETKNPDWFENRIVVPPIASAPVPPELWNIIISGLRENRIITFDYHGIWNNPPDLRRVRPYQLLFDTGVWYLYGYAEKRGAIRIFSLSRMKDAALTAETFTLPADYDYCAHNDGGYFGVFAGEKYHFRVAFYDTAVLWVGERKWAADQKIEETDDGVIIDFTSSQYNKVLEWVLSRGAEALPLEPTRLVDEWNANSIEMGKMAEWVIKENWK